MTADHDAQHPLQGGARVEQGEAGGAQGGAPDGPLHPRLPRSGPETASRVERVEQDPPTHYSQVREEKRETGKERDAETRSTRSTLSTLTSGEPLDLPLAGLLYVRLGWSLVFQRAGAKRPAGKWNGKDWPTNPWLGLTEDVILAQMAQVVAKGGALGMLTGSRSGGDPSKRSGGIVVLDVDTAKGGRIPVNVNADTLTATTPSGGLHLFYRVPDNARGLTDTNWRHGVDVRGEGGYLALPPAEGRTWKWNDAPRIAPAPLGLTVPPRRATKPRPGLSTLPNTRTPPGLEGVFTPTPDTYAEVCLADAAERVGQAGEGERNDTLNRETYHLLVDLVPERFTEEHVLDVMEDAGKNAGLKPGEIKATLESATRAFYGLFGKR